MDIKDILHKGDLGSREPLNPPSHCMTFQEEKCNDRLMEHDYSDQGQPVRQLSPLLASAAACNLCNKRFSTSRALNYHYERSHNQLGPEEMRSRRCPDCGRYFPGLLSLEKHRLLHRGKRSLQLSYWGKGPVQCCYCGSCFSKPGKLKEHQKTCFEIEKHEDLPAQADGQMNCLECGMSFLDEGELHQHYIQHARGEL
ncbi:zinc finger protein 576 [Spea bombifrons]|uniref:zinc finger protein 576 n=1 Tax=Spea bombifrons TaxID=233779 RepID=UPI00234B7084|nr:zinc finger protein 576 [Spea bombifrons]